MSKSLWQGTYANVSLLLLLPVLPSDRLAREAALEGKRQIYVVFYFNNMIWVVFKGP